MGILDHTPVDTGTAEYGCCDIRDILVATTDRCEASLAAIVEIINEHGRSAIDTELGGDATALTTLYNSIKTMLESTEVGKTIPAIPT
jgi:hypothetical protein